MGELGPGAAWWAVVVSAIPSVGAGIFMFMKWMGERKDTAEGRRLTRDQKEAEEIARDREKLNERTNAWIARLEDDNKGLREDLEARDATIKALEEALGEWRWYAYSMRGAMREARHIAGALERVAPQPNNMPAIVWQPEQPEPAPRKNPGA